MRVNIKDSEYDQINESELTLCSVNKKTLTRCDAVIQPHVFSLM